MMSAPLLRRDGREFGALLISAMAVIQRSRLIQPNAHGTLPPSGRVRQSMAVLNPESRLMAAAFCSKCQRRQIAHDAVTSLM